MRRPWHVADGVSSRMEWVWFIRQTAWKNAGFGSLRNIRKAIEDNEPRYDPTVTPLALSPREADARGQKTQISSLVKATANHDEANHMKFYSVHDYRALYLSGQATPTDVVRAILPLIREDTSPKGKHSAAWQQINIDLILKAAEASTERYRKNQSLGVLDGVPTAVKDEYDVDGYSTTLGSKRDYTGEATDDGSSNSWLVRKLEEAGAVNLGKLAMHEFGLGTFSSTRPG